jgi:glycosyltransferase involved in cell wall biosynthesis
MLGERQDVELYLQASDIFVLPSKLEGMPNVLLEAMACGLPCVTTRVSGTQDIIDDGTSGLLVEYGDPEALRTCLVALLRDSERRCRIGVNAKRTIDGRFSLERIADLYAMNYAELLGPHVSRHYRDGSGVIDRNNAMHG